ncbi:DUF2666 family protein [Candidatus Micrarchaeota archaeon]|nr:DUF2666 family protein [Candidatus Micrarchaeota archaeon]
MDEIILSGTFKDFRAGMRFDLEGKNEQDVASALMQVSNAVEEQAFKFSGIDTKRVNDFAKISGKGISSVAKFFEANSPGTIKAALEGAVPKKELGVVAESYLISQLLKKADVKLMPEATSDILPGKEEEDKEQIAFIGSYKGWISVKKLSTNKAQDYEISGILSGINHTAVNKYFDFAKISKDESVADAVTKGKRKSYINLAAALNEANGKLTGAKEDSFIILKIFEKLSFFPYPSPGMLTSAYPDIKPPKVKGRKPKG